MDVKFIGDLARLMKENGLTSMELSMEDLTIKLGRDPEPAQVQAAQPMAQPAASPFVSAPVEPEPQSSPKNGSLILSPTVGVFYAASSPESAPFVEVGDRVKKGDTLCIIEAMKLMNEIPSEVEGTIVEVCVSNGQVVEYNQPLFRIAT